MSFSIAVNPVEPDHLEPASPQSIFEDVLPFLQATCQPGEVIEIRALNATEQPCSSSTYLKTYGGCFDDLEAAAWSVARMDFEHQPSGVYMTLNPVTPDLLARSTNQLKWAPRNLATDEEIARRRWLVVDFDPVRPKSVSSTDDELGLALAVRDDVESFLDQRGWGQPLRVMSGNGGHLWYRIDLPADDGGLVQRVLKALASRFSSEQVDLDTGVFNPSRIMKVPGTMARKGMHFRGSDSNPARPHRRARWQNVGAEAVLVSREQLEALVQDLGVQMAEPKRPSGQASKSAGSTQTISLPVLQPIVDGCGFMKHCVEDAEQLSEPEWYAMLGIVGRCEDGEHWAHEYSKPHPGYEEAATDTKLRHALVSAGPRRCHAIAEDLGWEGCEGCRHQGRITSPIQLGHRGSSDRPTDDVSDGGDRDGHLDNRVLSAGAYRVDAQGLHRVSGTDDQIRTIPLSNFAAWIAKEETVDDGADQSLTFAIEAFVGGRWLTTQVPASEFEDMKWVTEKLGADAVIYAGAGNKQHVRAAIQLLSDDKQRSTLYQHTGWRKIDNRWAYLHADGAIGSEGSVDSVTTQLPAYLEPMALPSSATAPELQEAVRESLDLLNLGPDAVMVPILGGVYRSVLGPSGVNLHVMGRSGVFKSQLAALAQSHFGVGIDDGRLPAAWKDTGYSLMMKAFQAKDMLLVVDDFKPVGSQYDRQKLVRAADDLFRGNANGTGRDRLTRDAKVRTSKPPRTLVLSTGEDSPAVESILARLWEVPVQPGQIDSTVLSLAQQHAQTGSYASAMAAYVQWLANDYDAVVDGLTGRVEQVRQELQVSGHKRTATLAAQLVVGWEQFLAFALEVEAITQPQRDLYLARVQETLSREGEHQAAAMEETKPAEHFIEMINVALATGKAHVTDLYGDRPSAQFEAWGWRRGHQGTTSPHGEHIGWIERGDLYLNLEQALGVAQQVAGSDDQVLRLNPRVLAGHLHEGGMLKTSGKDSGRKTFKVRKSINGSRQNVLHLDATRFVQAEASAGEDGPFSFQPRRQREADAA